MSPEDIISELHSATPAEIEAQRAGMLNYQPGARNCMPLTPYVSIDLETTGSIPAIAR